jgi:hypothetical protein
MGLWPVSAGPLAPSFRWLTDTQRRFPDVFAGYKTGFIPPEFCVVVCFGRNKAVLHRRRAAPLTGSVADKI